MRQFDHTLYVIVESPKDAKVVEYLVQLHAKNWRVHSLYAGPQDNGITRLLKKLPVLIATAASKLKDGDMIAVLHDCDLQTCLDRGVYEKIAVICEKSQVTRVLAQDEIESWLLADSGLCDWLEQKCVSNTDTIKQPSEHLKSVLHKKKKNSYTIDMLPNLLKNLKGDSAKRSPSFQKALQMFLECANNRQMNR